MPSVLADGLAFMAGVDAKVDLLLDLHSSWIVLAAAAILQELLDLVSRPIVGFLRALSIIAGS